MNGKWWVVLGLLGLGIGQVASAAPHRTILSLDGVWQIDDSVGAEQPPDVYHHTTPVPGLAHSALPGFVDVDQYQSKQLLDGLVRNGLYAKSDYDKLGDIRGISHQARNYFWYRKRFAAPPRNAVAILKVGKAQFGTLVFLNGVRIGEHDACFTAGYFDVSRAIRWNRANDLVIRIGAHPGVLPANVTCGTDFEKNRWTPGIYDDVSLMTMDNPVIATVQVAPQLADAAHPVPGILVQTVLQNYTDRPVTTQLRQSAFERKSGAPAAGPAATMQVDVPAGATKTVTQTLAIAGAHLWSPADPFLYRLETATDGDDTTTRFGMREFRFDTVTQRAYLNGRPFFMRGSNIALHRFFEDSQVGTLPWDETWVHRLLVDIPRQLHWNSFRFSIGPVPDRWLEIADENGLLIENEYAIWTGSPLWTDWKSSYDSKQLISEFREWMRDDWNHPSVVLWDASNESYLPELATQVVPAVRGLDLSHRAWEDSYNSPIGANDPMEDHQYPLEAMAGGFGADDKTTPFALTDFENAEGPFTNPFLKTNHAMILNEYGWMWLNRDGTPTLLTDKLYPKLLGNRNTTDNRRALYAYLLAGETEFWRAYRHYAGVMHFVYLTASDAKGFTSDQFIDLPKLQLEPHFQDAMQRAFDPLGVYLNFWHPTLQVGATQDFMVAMVNDEDRSRAGTLKLVFSDAQGRPATMQEMPFTLDALGAQTYMFTLKAPARLGDYQLEARAVADDDPAHSVVSRRDVALVPVTVTAH